MKVNTTKSKTSVEFIVELDSGDLEPARLKALERLARNVKIPGFRNGKAPANVVEQHVDPNELSTTTLDVAVRRALPKLFEGGDVSPISVPHVDVMKYIPGEMAELKVTAEIFPEVQLGDYKHLDAVFQTREVVDEDVDDTINRIAQNMAETKAVKRAAQLTDEVIIDFVGKKDGVEFDGGKAKDYKLRLGSGQFIPGFEDGIVGHEPGDKFDLDITFPEDYGVADLAGQPTVFDVLLKQVNEVVVPEINDEFAQKTGAFQTIDELRADVRKNLEAQIEHSSTERYKDDLLHLLVDSSSTEAPQSIVEEQYNNMRDELLHNLEHRGQGLDDYLASVQQSKEEFESELRKSAERRIIGSIVMQKLSEELNIKVDDDEIAQQQAEMMEVYKKDPSALEQLKDPQVRAGIANRIRIDRTMDKLVELNRPHAQVVTEQPGKKSAKKSDKKADKKPAAKKPDKKASKATKSTKTTKKPSKKAK